MSTIKISELPLLPNINANTANTLYVGVDIPTGITGKMTLTTLAKGLYSNNNLTVGNNAIILPNTIAQFGGSANGQLQVNLQNFSNAQYASADLILTAANGVTSGFLDLGIAGPSHHDPRQTSQYPYDGYLTVTAPSTVTGNLILGTYSANANVNMVIGGANAENIITTFSSEAITFYEDIRLGVCVDDGLQANIVFNDTSIQSTAASPVAYSVASFSTANTANATATAAFAAGNTNATAISTANTFLQANDASTLAAAKSYALQNTTVTLAGTLTTTGDIVTGNVTASGNVTVGNYVTINNSQPIANLSVVSINSSNGFASIPDANTYMVHITGKETIPARILIDSFGTGTYSVISGRMARGTAAAPTATQANDVLAHHSGVGYGATKFTAAADAKIQYVANENMTDSAHGTRIELWTTANTTNTAVVATTITANTMTLPGSISTANGVSVIPFSFVGAQTAITLDFTKTTLQYTAIAANMVITPTNLVPGKTVKLWVTNTGGPGRTVTHGLTALNSTVGATTVTVGGGQSAVFEYAAFDTTTANCKVAITYQ